jgi:protein-tyrosine phosphatase
MKTNVLFLCSRNQWRSPTAEQIYANHPIIYAKSAGTEPSARIKVNTKLIEWADVIFVMEKKHKQRIKEKFGQETTQKQIIVLDIPDDYQYMDPELVEEIEAKVGGYL